MRAVILHTAEVSLARVLGLSIDEARETIREVVRAARPPKIRSPFGSRETWTTPRRWQRVNVVVERVREDEIRVCWVAPRHVPPKGGAPRA